MEGLVLISWFQGVNIFSGANSYRRAGYPCSSALLVAQHMLRLCVEKKADTIEHFYGDIYG
jgi:hypothetical protein